MPTVTIPNVGNVDFPDSMPLEQIHVEATKLAQGVSATKSLSPGGENAQQLGMWDLATTPFNEIAKVLTGVNFGNPMSGTMGGLLPFGAGLASPLIRQAESKLPLVQGIENAENNLVGTPLSAGLMMVGGSLPNLVNKGIGAGFALKGAQQEVQQYPELQRIMKEGTPEEKQRMLGEQAVNIAGIVGGAYGAGKSTDLASVLADRINQTRPDFSKMKRANVYETQHQSEYNPPGQNGGQKQLSGISAQQPIPRPTENPTGGSPTIANQSRTSGVTTPSPTPPGARGEDFSSSRPLAPVTYLGFQPGFQDIPGHYMYNLTEDHPTLGVKGSTIAGRSIEGKGLVIPESEKSKEVSQNAQKDQEEKRNVLSGQSRVGGGQSPQPTLMDKLIQQRVNTASSPSLLAEYIKNRKAETRKEGGAIALPVFNDLMKTEGEKRPGFTLDTPLVLMDKEVGGFAPDARITAQQMMGRLENLGKQGVVPPSELRVYKEQGLDKFLASNPTISETAKWMQENGPRVEVRKFGEGHQNETPKQKEFLQLQHLMDSFPESVRDAVRRRRMNNGPVFDKYDSAILGQQMNEHDLNQINRYIELGKDPEAFIPDTQRNTSHWSFVAPKPESEMPGYVEVAVTKPQKTIPGFPPEKKGGVQYVGRPDSLEPAQFPSSHSFPPNTLGFGRGYMETLPNGKKVFHVVEVQRDLIDKNEKTGKYFIPSHQQLGEFDSYGKASEALSKIELMTKIPYEDLVIKALIDHARSQGADAIAISDAETAMMSEGHDRLTTQENLGVGGWNKTEPTQAAGMRLHYDRTLPSIAEKLTGDKGVRVEFGEHKNAVEGKVSGYGYEDAIGNDELVPRKDLIFRNPDSTPKTSISARMYNLPEKGATPFSLFGKKTPKVTVGSEVKTIGGGIQKALEKNKEQGSIINPFGPLKTFAEKDLAPAIGKGVDALKATKDWIIWAFSPTSLAQTSHVDELFKGKGEGEKLKVKLFAAVADSEKDMDGLSQSELINFIDRVKTGSIQPTTKLQSYADLLRRWDDTLYNAKHEFKPGLPFLENHLRVLWKVIPGSGAKGHTESSIGSKRPFQGSQGSFKKHTLTNISEGLVKGGVPVSYNPFTLLKLEAQDTIKFVAANRAWEGLKKTGAVQFVKSGKQVPTGYKRLNDSIARVYFPTDKGLVKAGEWYIIEPVRDLLHNFLSKDYVREGKGGPVGRFFMNLKNMATMVELAYSPFHAFFITGEVMGSSVGLGLTKLATGRVEGLKDIGGALGSWATTYQLGSKIERMAKAGSLAQFRTQNPEETRWFDTNYPSWTMMLNEAFVGGAKVGLHEDFQSTWGDGFKKAVKEDNYVGAIVRALPALNQLVSAPLFNKYIPRLKLGIFFREYSFELERNQEKLLTGEVTRPELARKVWNFVDDRFGEMNYDNLYWNRTFKSLLQLGFRSVTWKMGDVRAFGKAAVDAGKIGKDTLKGNKPEPTLPLGWLFGMAAITALFSSIVSRSATGKWPWELSGDLIKNLTFPRIDEKNESARLSVPTYWKDLMHLEHSPTKFVTSSLSEPITRTWEDWENKDFYGVHIYEDDDSILKKSLELLGHELPQPIGISSYRAEKTQGASTVTSVAGGLGFPKAPSYVSDSSALQLAKELASKETPESGYTRQQAEKMSKERVAVGEIRSGQESARDAVSKGEIPKSRVKAVGKKASEDSLTYLVGTRLAFADVVKVYEVASKEEREELRPVIDQRIRHSTSLGYQGKAKILDELDQIDVKNKEKKSIFSGFQE